jgi:hypothetical protein
VIVPIAMTPAVKQLPKPRCLAGFELLCIWCRRFRATAR